MGIAELQHFEILLSKRFDFKGKFERALKRCAKRHLTVLGHQAGIAIFQSGSDVARKIFGAALDVLDQEPIAADCPLSNLDNVILTDHTGWYSEASVRSIQEKAAQAAVEILMTGVPTNWVNKF